MTTGKLATTRCNQADKHARVLEKQPLPMLAPTGWPARGNTVSKLAMGRETVATSKMG